MQITITVPEMKCDKCDVTAPVQPRLLCLRAQAPKKLQDALSAALKETTGMVATDDNNQTWDALDDGLPIGWVDGPASSHLCGECGALWREAQKAFLEQPRFAIDLPPVVAENSTPKARKKPKMTPALVKTSDLTININGVPNL